MKILLTGASGMLGKNIIEHELYKGYDFLIPNRNELDLLNLEKVNYYLNLNKPDFIIHAAAKVGGIQSNILNPIDYFNLNIQMGLNLINSAKKNNKIKIINIGSSCMYPKDINRPLNEQDLLSGKLELTNEAYALSKLSIAKYCEYLSQDKFEYKTIISCNLYGRYDKFQDYNSHLVAAIIKKINHAKLTNSNTVEIWGDGKARREFMYAKDLADFIFYSIKNFDKMPQNINAGIGVDYSILEYYEMIGELMSYSGNFTFNTNLPSGMKQKLNDITLLNKFGWKHKIGLKEGLKETISYYLNNQV